MKQTKLIRKTYLVYDFDNNRDLPQETLIETKTTVIKRVEYRANIKDIPESYKAELSEEIPVDVAFERGYWNLLNSVWLGPRSRCPEDVVKDVLASEYQSYSLGFNQVWQSL